MGMNMIQYALKCADGHQFDSWFQSASAFDKLHSAGMISCTACGTSDVSKAIMAPRVNAKSDAPVALSEPVTPQEEAIAELKTHVEKNSTYVGKDFASQARAMHDGDAPARMIHGETSLPEAKKLLQDGIPVAPLPFRPSRNTN